MKYWGLMCLFYCAVLQRVDGNSEKSTLYFGFFFNESTAESIKTITHNYLNGTILEIPEFKDFLQNVSSSSGVSDVFKYYTKPRDPNTGSYDPFYHVTAKYCGAKQDACAKYAKKNSQFINATFEMQLVGYVLTNRTFGIRVNLTGNQLKLFEEDTKGYKGTSAGISTEEPRSALSTLPGIKLEALEDSIIFPVTSTKAHITLGCAPGVPAVTTGPDLVKVIQYEEEREHDSGNDTLEWTVTDPAGGQMTVTLYKPNSTDENNPEDFVFVIYPHWKILANATLLHYYQPTSSSDPAAVVSQFIIISMCVWHGCITYFHE